MGTRLEFFKGKLKLFSFLFLILLILFVNLGPSFALTRGDYLEETTDGNKKEEQLLRKIEIIHETFPQQTDEAALYATIVHRGTMTDYIEDSYDENFDEEEFRTVWTDLQASFNKLTSDAFAYAQLLGSFIEACIKCWIEPQDTDDDGEDDTEGYYEENCVLETVIDMYADQWSHTTDVNLEAEIKKPKSIDLLTAATIVMLDSSGWIGTYSDDKYKEALAGEGLVGNLIHRDNLISNFVATLMNGVFCTVRNVMDIATDGAFDEFALGTYRPGNNFDDLKGFTSQGTSIADKLSRFYTMDRICALGFIGGTYNHVQNPNLSTEAGKEQYQAKKDIVAEQIVGLAEDLRASSGGGSSNNCVVNPSSSGAFATWKQADPQWGSISLGGGRNMAAIGCLVTSLAIQIARSGTKITNLPSGYSSFNPGAFVTVLNQNGGFTSGGAFTWSGYQSIAPNVVLSGRHTAGISDTQTLANVLSQELSTPAEGKYQKFILLNIHHNGSAQHWVAVDSVSNGQVTIFDPGGVSGNTLDDNYSGWVVDTYRVMYATDVLQGQIGTSTDDGSGGIYCETSGNIVIPEEYGGGGFTVTVYNDWNWAYDQGKVYDIWAASGAQWDDGIAVIDGRYLIACTKKFGNVGDKVDFFLDDGTKIPAIIADIKNEGDSGANEWGHNNGKNVLEFEVSHVAYYQTYKSNPGTNGWHMEWAGKRVSSATNLGENILS